MSYLAFEPAGMFEPEDRFHGSGPCRSIPITPEMRARDAAQQLQRRDTIATAWPIKATLGQVPDEPAPAVRRTVTPLQRAALQSNIIWTSCPWCGYRGGKSAVTKHQRTCPQRPAPAPRKLKSHTCKWCSTEIEGSTAFRAHVPQCSARGSNRRQRSASPAEWLERKRQRQKQYADRNRERVNDKARANYHRRKAARAGGTPDAP